MKVNSLIAIIDDVYDVYDTLDECELFTDAVGGYPRGSLADFFSVPNQSATYNGFKFEITNLYTTKKFSIIDRFL